MQFKVGDRVEVLEPAEGLIDGQANNVGLGSVVSVDEWGNQLKIKVDDNDRSWWYEPDKVRRALIVPKPTPSITVGTQVRLTGVVTGPTRKIDGAIGVQVDAAPGEYRVVYVLESDLEVIRQPFKRGEVAYFEDHDITCVVLEDEQNGRMLLIEAGEGKYATYVDAAKYERRP